MKVNQSAAILDWQANIQSLGFKEPLVFSKLFLLLLIFLLSLVAFPWYGTHESSLNQESVIDLINQNRATETLYPLRRSIKLEQAARAKARDILENEYFAHTSPTGAKAWDFIRDTGMNFSFAGENLAINYTNGYELISDLMQSPSHRDNLLSPLFSEIGVASVRGEYHGQQAVVTVQMFARP